MLARMLFSPMPNIINEFTIENALYYFDQDQTGWEHALLKGAHLSRAQVLDIYGDFVEHTWPSFYMCYDAFRAYFIKHGHPVDEPKLKRLYAVFGVNQRTFVDFYEFLIGLVCLEPACPSTLSSRLWFIFRFAKLPIALVVDETILCAHGGIPSSSGALNELVELPKEMAHLKRDAPMAYEMVTRYPEEEEANKAQQVTSEESRELQRDSSADGSQVAKSTTIAPKASELDLGGTSKSQASDVSLAVTSSPDVSGAITWRCESG